MCYVYNQWYDISCAALYVNLKSRITNLHISLFLCYPILLMAC